jgi:uncharacterized membrane protein
MEAGGKVTASPIKFKPGVFSSYGNGWRQLWKYFLELLLILIIYWVISIPTDLISWKTASPGWNFVSIAYGLLIISPVFYGLCYAYLKAARGDKLEIKDMFTSFQNYWNAVLASLLVTVIVVVGFILIIIPGFFFFCKLSFTPFLVVDRKMEVIEAVKASWKMTKGYGWKVFLIGLLGIPIAIAGAICLGVGIIIAGMWIMMALASLYHSVSTSDETAVPQPSPIIP